MAVLQHCTYKVLYWGSPDIAPAGRTTGLAGLSGNLSPITKWRHQQFMDDTVLTTALI